MKDAPPKQNAKRNAPQPLAQPKQPKPAPKLSLADLRRQFPTKIIKQVSANKPFPEPPAGVFDLIQYEAPIGQCGAYLTPDPKDGKKHPAIVWITGGDCSTVTDVWSEQPATNEQHASAYRKAGIVMMFPTMRGGNTNPGVRETFFGEVDDVVAAIDYLAQIEYVDPTRIYLGGHSSGGTMVALVAASTDTIRATFAFGSGATMTGYPEEFYTFDRENKREMGIRSPVGGLELFSSPTFFIEGQNSSSANVTAMKVMSVMNKNKYAEFLLVQGANHFSILDPVNRLIAKKILADEGPTCNIKISLEELNALFTAEK